MLAVVTSSFYNGIRDVGDYELHSYEQCRLNLSQARS